MQRLLSILLILFGLQWAPMALAEERAAPDDAASMVKKVINQMKASSRDAVIAEINAFNPKWRDRDIYVTVMDMNGLELAHGSNKRMQGVNLMNLKDQDGKSYIRSRIEIAKSKGSGWQDYVFVNPVNKQLEPKSVYFELYDGVIVSAGVYKKK